MSQQRTLEQERAADAWEQVKDVRDNGTNAKGDYRGDYSSLARGAIAFIQINGLGQSVAFWRAKGFKGGVATNGRNEHSDLFSHVSNWVLRQMKKETSPHLLDWIVSTASPDAYRRATTEAIAYLSWIKRFAEAELPKSEKE